MLFELFLAHYLFFSFQTCIQRYRSEKYQQPSEIKTSVNVSVKQTAKNCQLELGQLFNTVFFLAKGGLSFRKYCKLCSLQSKNDIVLAKILLLILHVADLFHLSASLEKITLENPSTNTLFFLVLSDGSTDFGVIEQEAIHVQYLENGCPQTKFGGIKPLIKGDAEGLLLVIEDVLKSLRAKVVHLLKKMNT